MAEQRSHPLLSVVCSILLPVFILNKCSVGGDAWYQLGAMPALVVALCLPIGYGLWGLLKRHGGGIITFMGITTTLLTGVVTIYAQSGAEGVLRPSTPWVYAAKEGLLPLMIAVMVLLGGTGKGALLRSVFYTEEAFHTSEVEARVAQLGRQAEYEAVLGLMNCLMAGCFLASAVLSFFIALHFQLPVLELPAAQQAEAYNYAVGSITWWSWVLISIPILVIFIVLCFYLSRKLRSLTGQG